MADVLRSCSKTACRWPAAASLSYRYATRQVWLLDLVGTPDPSLYDLCPHHADALVVPQGWERVDDRTVQEVMVEPSAHDRAEEAARRRAGVTAEAEPAPSRALVGAGARGNRYADLVAQLPRLAAEAGVPGAVAPPATIRAAARPALVTTPPAPTAAPRPSAKPLHVEDAAPVVQPPTRREQPVAPAEPPLPPAGAAPSQEPSVEVVPEERPPAREQRISARPSAPVPSRELAPSPPPDATPYAGAEQPRDSGVSVADGGEPPLPGQLTIPVDDDSAGGVVVPFDLAGARRRSPRP